MSILSALVPAIAACSTSIDCSRRGNSAALVAHLIGGQGVAGLPAVALAEVGSNPVIPTNVPRSIPETWVTRPLAAISPARSQLWRITTTRVSVAMASSLAAVSGVSGGAQASMTIGSTHQCEVRTTNSPGSS